MQGCTVYSIANIDDAPVEQQVALAFILLAVGVFISWLAFYLCLPISDPATVYHRYHKTNLPFLFVGGWVAAIFPTMLL